MPNIRKLSELESPSLLTTRTGLISRSHTRDFLKQDSYMLNPKAVAPQTPTLSQSCSLVILPSLAQSILKWTLTNSPTNYFSNLNDNNTNDNDKNNVLHFHRAYYVSSAKVGILNQLTHKYPYEGRTVSPILPTKKLSTDLLSNLSWLISGGHSTLESVHLATVLYFLSNTAPLHYHFPTIRIRRVSWRSHSNLLNLFFDLSLR